MYEVTRRIEELNHIASRLTGLEHGVFERASLKMPKFNPAELGFILLVSYLYVLYFEVGRVGAIFLEDKFDAYSIDADMILRKHRLILRQLRTYLQHNLNPQEQHDKHIQEQCENLFESTCGSRVPVEESHWWSCTQSLLDEALRYVEALARIVREIERDESRDAICRQWVSRVKRYHPPEAFDDLIKRVIHDMGRDRLDPVRLRSRFHEKWVQELEMLQEDYDFETEARRLVERDILTMSARALPITGRDIMEEFQIAPGPRVGELLGLARKIHDARPCSRDDLIAQVRKEIATSESSGIY